MYCFVPENVPEKHDNEVYVIDLAAKVVCSTF
jgi:hypothetical protein